MKTFHAQMIIYLPVACFMLVAPAVLLAADKSKELKMIRRVDIIHLSHTDIGFTDHPAVCRQQQMRFLDVAIDAVLAPTDLPPEAQFRWTAEATLSVDDWWQAADDARRKDLLKAIDTGRLEITAMAMNQTPTLDAAEWHTILHWLPEEVWQRAKPRAAVQDDVNGFPRAGAIGLLDRGVDNLLMGINATLGEAPFKRPSAFWWKMPDGRRMFVWLGDSYPEGFSYFFPDSWRRGPVPESTDTRYRPPRPGETFRTDEATLREAHAHLLTRLRNLESHGYAYPTLIISTTNEWRIDNDPPFPPLADFVAAWNRLGLEPQLRLTTVREALQQMREEIGKSAPEHEGEFTDWWADGDGSGPREVAASRRAKRLAAAATSPVWGPLDPNAKRAADTIYRDLCLFDEHTWGSGDSVSQPHSLDTWAQYNEKSRMAYRPMSLAKLLLSQRARTAVYGLPEGLYVANTAKDPWSGWITMPVTCLRGDFHSLEDPKTGQRIPLEFVPGYRQWVRPKDDHEMSISNTSQTFPDNSPNQQARFWVQDLDAQSIRRLLLSEKTAEPQPQSEKKTVEVTLDEHGWPTSATWPGMTKPLFDAGTGDFLSVDVQGFAARWAFLEAFGKPDAERLKLRGELLKEVPAVANAAAEVQQNAHTTVYTQTLEHPRLKWFIRRLELFHDQPRARLTMRFHRTESELPEVFFAVCNVPCGRQLPTLSNGGLPFVPYEDQLPGTCRDYFTIDAWAQYPTPAGRWLWTTRDAPLVTFGQHNVLAQRNDPPENPGRILSMVFNNIWFTNFVADSHGAFEFQYDLAWSPADQPAIDPGQQTDTLLFEPQVVINPELRESPVYTKRLHQP